MIRERPRVGLSAVQARRMLRFDLGRVMQGITHQEIAGWLGVSRASVTMALAGTNLFSKPALEVMLGRVGAGEWLPRLEALTAMARGGGAASKRDSDLVVGVEAFAERVTVVDLWGVPQVLRTKAYAAAVAGLAGVVGDGARGQRQAAVVGGVDPLPLCWITGERAVRCAAGDRRVAEGQATFLAEITDRPNVTIRVVPGDLPPLTPFQLVHGTPPVVLESGRLGVLHSHDADDVERAERVVEGLTALALSEGDSRALLGAEPHATPGPRWNAARLPATG